MTMAELTYYGTGRRKTSVARVWLKPGTGRVLVNHKTMDEYFGRETHRMILNQPFDVTQTGGKFDVLVNVKGGGPSGQAGAVKHGISRALLQVSADNRKTLKRAGFLTRDAREVERQKYGLRGARARFQFSKR